MEHAAPADTGRLARRSILAAGGVLAAGAVMLPVGSALARTERSLDTVASPGARRFGSAIAWGRPGQDGGSIGNPAYAGLVSFECGLVVPENAMKWQALRPSPTAFSFDRCDALVAWATTRRLGVRGHNLLWHQSRWLPAWLNDHDFGSRPAMEAERIVADHIRTIVGRYGTRIDSWDVVNEAVRPSDGALYETALSRATGGAAPLLDFAFHQARAAAPRAQLVYNDYMGWEPGNDRHRDGVLRLLEGFRRRGTPVDALGLQSHLATQGTDVSIGAQQREWQAFLSSVTQMGYDLIVTELDVRDNHLPPDVTGRDRAVADYARAYLDATLGPRTGDVLCWGLCDRYSWIETVEPRADGAPRRPTPYDAQGRAKPLRDAIAAALASAPRAAPRRIGARS